MAGGHQGSWCCHRFRLKGPPRERTQVDRFLAGLPAADRPGPRWAGARRSRAAQRAAGAADRRADQVVKSVCPYCAVGCGQNVYVKDEKVIQIEGDPDSPGQPRAGCARRARASLQLTTGAARESPGLLPAPARHRVGGPRPRHGDGHDRRPGDRDPASRLAVGGRRAGAPAARSASPASAARPSTTRRTTSSRSCSPRWARSRSRTRPGYDTPPPSPVWGPRSAAAGPPPSCRTCSNSDCILIEGSNMAECHPVGFQWVMEAKARGRDGHPRRPAVHPHQRAWPTCTCRSGPAPTSPSSAALINHVLQQRARTSASTSSPTPTPPTIIERGLPATPRTSTASSPASTPSSRTYDLDSWQYEGAEVAGGRRRARRSRRRGRAGGASPVAARPRAARPTARAARPLGTASAGRDETLQHPRCVFQILKRHFARYTPEMVEQVCGIAAGPVRAGLRRADRATPAATAPPRSCYAVGWTQHTVGAQYIRTAAILQLLLGNIGRPGGGILALRGHA